MNFAERLLQLSPVAYWRMGALSGTVEQDASGNGKTGTYVGGPTLGEAGAIVGDTNKAVKFTGGEGMSFPDIDLSNSDFTFFAYLKLTEAAGAGGYVIVGGAPGAGPGFRVNPGSKLALTSTGVIDAAEAGQTLFTPGTYYQVAVTYVHATGAFVYYINGAVASSGTFANTNFTDGRATNWLAGGGGSSDLLGTLDEAAIFNYALSPGNITALNTEGSDADAGEPTRALRIYRTFLARG